MAIITLGTIVGYFQDIADWATRRSASKPIILKSGRTQQILTTNPLDASGTFTSATFDSIADPQVNFVTSHCFANQDGTLSMLISMDGINWNHTQLEIPVSANVATVMGWVQPLDRYYKFIFTNSTVAQTIFRLSTTSYN